MQRAPLLVVGGLPGAGKTTLLRRAWPAALDSEDLRGRVPGPLVHVVHLARLALALLVSAEPVVVHLRATREGQRRWLVRLARLTGRRAELVLVAVDPHTARRSQVHRGRVVEPRAFLREVDRWRALEARVRLGRLEAAEGWASVDLLEREAVPTAQLRPTAPRPLAVPRLAA